MPKKKNFHAKELFTKKYKPKIIKPRDNSLIRLLLEYPLILSNANLG